MAVVSPSEGQVSTCQQPAAASKERAAREKERVRVPTMGLLDGLFGPEGGEDGGKAGDTLGGSDAITAGGEAHEGRRSLCHMRLLYPELYRRGCNLIRCSLTHCHLCRLRDHPYPQCISGILFSVFAGCLGSKGDAASSRCGVIESTEGAAVLVVWLVPAAAKHYRRRLKYESYRSALPKVHGRSSLPYRPLLGALNPQCGMMRVLYPTGVLRQSPYRTPFANTRTVLLPLLLAGQPMGVAIENVQTRSLIYHHATHNASRDYVSI